MFPVLFRLNSAQKCHFLEIQLVCNRSTDNGPVKWFSLGGGFPCSTCCTFDHLSYCQTQFSMVVDKLASLGIPCYEGVRGGLFVWANISQFLPENTFEAEREFLKTLIEEVSNPLSTFPPKKSQPPKIIIGALKSITFIVWAETVLSFLVFFGWICGDVLYFHLTMHSRMMR